MAHIVTCIYCKHKFDRDKFPFVQVSQRRYAHPECAAAETHKKTEEEEDKEALDQYILSLFKTTYVDPRIQKQIKQYIEEYHYTYSGIHKALKYHFDICGNSVEKANGGIGIVPYVYQHAFNYYYALWQAQQKNIDKDVHSYIPVVRSVTAPRPQRRIKKKLRFTFLDEEEDNSGL